MNIQLSRYLRTLRRGGSRLRLFGTVAVLSVGVTVTGVVLYYAYEVREARHNTLSLVAAAYTQFGREMELGDLSVEQQGILLQVEDPAFRDHRGVDLSTPGAGMTTLTQGMVKQLYFPEGFRQGVRKIRQTLIARFALDPLVSKNDQLTLFLNIAYFGHHEGQAVHGFSNAARVYYGKDFQDLEPDEYLSLTAMFINPNGFKPGTQRSRDRVRRIRQYLQGAYQPLNVADVQYDGVERQWRFRERAVLKVLALITGG